MKVELIDYSLRAVSGGEDAQGEVNIRVKYKDSTYTGKGTSTDITEASAKAYVHAINKIVAMQKGK